MKKCLHMYMMLQISVWKICVNSSYRYNFGIWNVQKKIASEHQSTKTLKHVDIFRCSIYPKNSIFSLPSLPVTVCVTSGMIQIAFAFMFFFI